MTSRPERDARESGSKPACTRSAGRVRAGRAIGLALVAAAVVKERRKPPSEREWRGELAGFVPYDLRRPTLERLRTSVWNPDSPRLFPPQAFGVGWTLNVGRVVRLTRDACRGRGTGAAGH